MSIFKTLLDIIRGHAAQADESLKDSQAIVLAEVRLKAAKENQDKAQSSLVTVIASKKRAEQKAAELAEQASKLEQSAIDAASKDTALAEKLALKAADLRTRQTAEEADFAKYSKESAQIEARLNAGAKTLENLQRDLESLKVNQTVIDAQVATSVALKDGADSLGEAKANLDRLKEKQARQQAQIEAAESHHASNDTDSLLAQADALSKPSSGGDALAALLAKKQSSQG